MGTITRGAMNNFTTGGVIKPAGINDTSVASLTELENVAAGGAMNLISEQTASGNASIEFTSGIDSTYPTYIIKLINIHPANDRPDFTMNLTTDGTNFNVSKTTTVVECYSWENDSTPIFLYRDLDLANGTGEQSIAVGCGNDNDENICSIIHLFNPSSTTFVKHFLIDTQFTEGQGLCFRQPVAGYANTTSAITGIRFKFASGNIDSGTFKLYGISGS